MDFLSLVLEGVEKSNKSKEAIAAVNEVFNKINLDLMKYPRGELKLERSRSTMANIAAITGRLANVESDYFIQDRVTLSLKIESRVFTEEVAGWKQHISGFPCTLKFDGQELSCDNPIHLIHGLSELLASVRFGNAVNSLVSQSAKSIDKEKPSTPSLVAPVLQPASKPVQVKRTGSALVAAKPLAKAAAKRASPAKAGGGEAIPAKPTAAKPKPRTRKNDESNQPK